MGYSVGFGGEFFEIARREVDPARSFIGRPNGFGKTIGKILFRLARTQSLLGPGSENAVPFVPIGDSSATC